MSWEAWMTLGVVTLMVLAMMRNLAGPDVVMTGGLTVLLTAGIVTPTQAFQGFANPGMLAVGALFVVAAGMRETGAMDAIMRVLLGQPRSLVSAQLRMMLPVSAVSAFLNNTPVVAMMVPLVSDWARRIGQSPSKLLIPLSYASIVGGTCTLIGTSTNLVVYGLVLERLPALHIGFFEIAWVGLPVLLAATAYMLVTSRWLLPSRGSGSEAFANPREYTVAMRVEPSSPIVGKTIEQAGLRQLPGLFLYEVERTDGELRAAPGPHVKLRAGDQLRFTGVIESVVDLRRIRGLVPAEEQADKLAESRPNRRLVEAVVAPSSPLLGMNVRETRFRTRFNAAIVAVHRQGERVHSKIGDIQLRPGDTLLLETQPGFVETFRNDGTFALVSEVANSQAPRHERADVAIVLLVVMVTLTASETLSLINAALLAAGAMLLTRCLTGSEARRSIDLGVLLTIAASFGVGAAIERSGLAGHMAHHLVAWAAPLGPLGLLTAVYITTTLLTSVITNNAAAVLMFPLTVAAAADAGLDPLPFIYVLMLGASASFMTPIGYQTNLMVYGPGRYRFDDFIRFGVPLQLLLALVTVVVAWRVWL